MNRSRSIADKIAYHLLSGEALDLRPEHDGRSLLDDTEKIFWGPEQTVEARSLRDLLIRSTAADPRGLRLKGAYIIGRIELDHVDLKFPLILEDCLLDGGLSVVAAHLSTLTITRCRLKTDSLPNRDSALSRETVPALNASELRVDHSISLEGSKIVSYADGGTVNLLAARVSGDLICNSTLESRLNGIAFFGDRLEVGGSIFFRGSTLPAGPELGEPKRFEAIGSVRLMKAHVGGDLDLDSACLRAKEQPALYADGLHVDGDVFLRDVAHVGLFSADTESAEGAVRLMGARVGGMLACTGAYIRNFSSDPDGNADPGSGGPALVADCIRIERNARFWSSILQGAGPDGVLRLKGARIGHGLDCSDINVTNHTDQKYEWDCDGLTYSGRPSLSLFPLPKAISPDMPADVPSADAGPAGCQRPQADHPAESSSDPKEDNQAVRPKDGVDGVPRRDDRNLNAWLEVFRNHTAAYAAQPYQQLAAAYRAEGHDDDVRTILIAQRRDQVARALTKRSDRLWAKTTGLLLGYGYKPWRALWALLAVFVTSVFLALVLGDHGGLAHKPSALQPVSNNAPCKLIETVAVGLDLGTPLLSARTGSLDCIKTTSATGSALTVSSWLLQILAWGLAALFVAGFTGIVRRT